MLHASCSAQTPFDQQDSPEGQSASDEHELQLGPSAHAMENPTPKAAIKTIGWRMM